MSIKAKLAQQLQANQQAHAEAEVELIEEESLSATYIPVARVHPNPYQPRSVFDEGAIAELAESIKSEGILQPIVVRPNGTNGYQLISGERRLRAFKLLGRDEIPAVIKSMSDQESAVSALQENIKRENLTDFEVSEGLRKLIELKEQTGDRPTATELQRQLSVSRPAIYRYLSFHSLPEEIQLRLRDAPGLMTGTTSLSLEQWIKRARASGVRLDGYVRVLGELLDEVERGKLKQNKIISRLEAALLTKKPKPTPSIARDLLRNSERIGKWVDRDGDVQITLTRDHFSESQLQEIQNFIMDRVFSE